jgi:hypothetical protein
MENNKGMEYDGMNFISYHHLPSILFFSFLKYSNNYFILLCSIPLYSIDPNGSIQKD